MNVYLLPMISLSKYVVKLGWSSVKPAAASVPLLKTHEGVVMQTFDAQVSTHERLAHIDMVHLDFDFILLAIRSLAALEAATGTKEGRGAVGDKLRKLSAVL
jgi:hypothetical protein